MEGKNPAFVKVFGEDAVMVKMGEYTVLPNGVVQRQGHNDEAYADIVKSSAQKKYGVVGTNGKYIVIEAFDKVEITREERGASQP